jgi:hypothetical protein
LDTSTPMAGDDSIPAIGPSERHRRLRPSKSHTMRPVRMTLVGRKQPA